MRAQEMRAELENERIQFERQKEEMTRNHRETLQILEAECVRLKQDLKRKGETSKMMEVKHWIYEIDDQPEGTRGDASRC